MQVTKSSSANPKNLHASLDSNKKKKTNQQLRIEKSVHEQLLAEIAQIQKESWATSERMQECKQVHGQEVVDRVVEATEAMWNLSTHLGLTQPELFEMALYIETELPAKIADEKYYLKKEKSGLARTIEYDKKSKLIFIHLKTHGIGRLGKGWHKKVTKSILYDTKAPEIVANSTFMDDGDEEIKTVKEVRNQPGLAHTYAITEHKKEKTGKKVISLIQQYCNGGSLLSHLHNGTTLSGKELLIVARDLMSGLESLHEKDLVHRDMHGGNFLLDIRKNPVTEERKVSAVLIDLGQARDATKAKREAPKVQVPHRFNPPESFWRDKTWIDTKKVDVYALGFNLYNLYFREPASWATKKDFAHIAKFGDATKLRFRKELTKKMEAALAKHIKKLEKKDSVYDKFAKLILEMLDPDQNKRHSAAHYRKKLDALIEKA